MLVLRLCLRLQKGGIPHAPIECKVEEERDALLRYFRVYGGLLDACRKSGVLMVGVSKEGRSMFHRDYLLSLILDEKLGEFIEEEDKKLLKEIF